MLVCKDEVVKINKRKATRIGISVFSFVLALLFLNFPVFSVKANAESLSNYLSKEYFLTEKFNEQVNLNGGKTIPVFYGYETIYKLIYGKELRWYIAGRNDDGTLALVIDPNAPIASLKGSFNSSKDFVTDASLIDGIYDGKKPDKVYANCYGASELRRRILTASMNCFTKSQQSFMADSSIYTYDARNEVNYLLHDKMYAGYGHSFYNKYFTVGNNSEDDLCGGLKVSLVDGIYSTQKKVKCWLRSPSDFSDETQIMITDPGHTNGWINFEYVTNLSGSPVINNVWPAFHLDLSSVLFASKASRDSKYSSGFADSFSFRMDGKDIILSDAVCCGDCIYVNPAYNHPNMEGSLCIQGINSKDEEFFYFYAIPDYADDICITKKMISDTDFDFADCKIWIEKSVDGIEYAKPVSYHKEHVFVNEVCTCCGYCKYFILNGRHFGGKATCANWAVCSFCKHEYAPPTQDHKWDDGKITTPAACGKAGVKTFTCMNEGCGKTITDVIPALTHKWDDGKITTPSTCTKTGVKTYTCIYDGCGKTITEELPALTHKWDEGEITTPSTCIETGVKTFKCLNPGCSEIKTEVIAKLLKPKKNEAIEDNSGISYKVTDANKDEVTYISPCKSKSKVVTVPSSISVNGINYKVTKIYAKALKGNTSVTKVKLPKSITEIDAESFKGCKKLISVSMPQKLTKIGKNAFKGCTGLTQITIPEKVTKLGAGVFDGCKKLKTITIKSSKLTSSGIASNAFKGLSKNTIIKVPVKKLKTYEKLFKKKGFKGKVKAISNK